MTNTIKSHEDLDVWNDAIELAEKIHRLTKLFPSNTGGLQDQLKRSSASIPANIAEGRSRGHTREFIQFLSVALGSLSETQSHIELAKRLEYAPTENISALSELLARVGKRLNALQNSLQKRLKIFGNNVTRLS